MYEDDWSGVVLHLPLYMVGFESTGSYCILELEEWGGLITFSKI